MIRIYIDIVGNGGYNKVIKVAVCDDETQAREKLISFIKEYFKEQNRPAWVAEFKTGEGLLKSNIRYDIIFLDIEMPNLNGIETAIKLRKWDVNSKIIFVTHYDKYSSSAYKVHAFDYICKPIREKKIYDVLGEAIRYLENASEKQKYAFKTEQGVVTIELDDIYYFEYMARKVIIKSSKGKYVASYSLKELYDKFRNFNFESPHKSFIINMLHIKHIKGFDIFIENGDTIPLAQKRAVEFKKKFNDFLQSTFDKI